MCRSNTNKGLRARASVGVMSHMEMEQSEEAEYTTVESTAVVDWVELEVIDPVCVCVIEMH